VSSPTVFRRIGLAGAPSPSGAARCFLREGPSSVSFIFLYANPLLKAAVNMQYVCNKRFDLIFNYLTFVDIEPWREKGNEEARDVALFSYIGCRSRKHDSSPAPAVARAVHSLPLHYSLLASKRACQGKKIPICSCRLYGKMDL
jgi:hypothetical protein